MAEGTTFEAVECVKVYIRGPFPSGVIDFMVREDIAPIHNTTMAAPDWYTACFKPNDAEKLVRFLRDLGAEEKPVRPASATNIGGAAA